MNITEFVIDTRYKHDYYVRNRSASEVLLGPPKQLNWYEAFSKAGYHCVQPSMVKHEWTQIHKWCAKQFGSQHYSWNGGNFWFEREEDAILFALKWV